jgi:hypothetical protein
MAIINDMAALNAADISFSMGGVPSAEWRGRRRRDRWWISNLTRSDSSKLLKSSL